MDYFLIAAGTRYTARTDVASDHSGDFVVAVVVAEADDVCCRRCGGGESGSGRVMVGSRLLRVDAKRALSSSLSPGTCTCLCLCVRACIDPPMCVSCHFWWSSQVA